MIQPTRARKPLPTPPSPAPVSPAAPLARLLNPLRQAAAAFFKHDVALRRAGDGLQLVFEQRIAAGKPRPETPAEAAARKQQQELALMLAQLGGLLDELPETRRAMRHLAFVEKALAAHGLKALERLPLHVLQRGLEQFEGLVTNWSAVGLAALRSKIAVVVIDRERRDDDGPTGVSPTAIGGSTSLLTNTLPLPLVEAADDEALAAAYAALGALAPPGGPTPDDAVRRQPQGEPA